MLVVLDPIDADPPFIKVPLSQQFVEAITGDIFVDPDADVPILERAVAVYLSKSQSAIEGVL